jgi:hypothetical protein
VVYWPEFLATDPEVPGFLRSAVSGTGFTQPLRITEELLEWKSSGSESRKARFTAVGIRYADHTKVATNFAGMRQSLGRYSSLAD